MYGTFQGTPLSEEVSRLFVAGSDAFVVWRANKKLNADQLKRAVLYYGLAVMLTTPKSLERARLYYRLASTLWHVKTAQAYVLGLQVLEPAITTYLTYSERQLLDTIKCYDMQIRLLRETRDGRALMECAGQIMMLADEPKYASFRLLALDAKYAIVFARGQYDIAKAVIEETKVWLEIQYQWQIAEADSFGQEKSAAKRERYLTIARQHELKIGFVEALSISDTVERERHLKELTEKFFDEVYDIDKDKLAADPGNKNQAVRVEKNFYFLFYQQLLRKNSEHALNYIMRLVKQTFSGDQHAAYITRIRKTLHAVAKRFVSGERIYLAYDYGYSEARPCITRNDAVIPQDEIVAVPGAPESTELEEGAGDDDQSYVALECLLQLDYQYCKLSQSEVAELKAYIDSSDYATLQTKLAEHTANPAVHVFAK